jgi:hypothetical protein
MLRADDEKANVDFDHIIFVCKRAWAAILALNDLVLRRGQIDLPIHSILLHQIRRAAPGAV